MQVFGLYGHIRANRWRSAFLISGLFLLVYLVLYALLLVKAALAGGPSVSVLMARAGQEFVRWWPAATAAALVWIVIAFRWNQTIIDAVTGARTIERAENPRLWNLLENLCISRGLRMPQLKVMETEALNAYASGMTEAQYAVTVTQGLLDTLTDAELEAVLAHELTHIRNDDVRLMVVAMIVAGIIAFSAELVFRMLARGPRLRLASDSSERKGSAAAAAIVIAVVLIGVAWLLSGVLRFALSRSREYLADAGAVELTKNPDAMISALVKISGRAEISGVPSGLMDMCIENERSGIVDLFATHPPIDRRIEALVQQAGGQMPVFVEELAPPAPFPAVAAPSPQAASAVPTGSLDFRRRGPWAR